MTTEIWIIILGISGLNITTLVGGLIHIVSRLTRIETDVKWISRNCPSCQPNSENPLK